MQINLYYTHIFDDSDFCFSVFCYVWSPSVWHFLNACYFQLFFSPWKTEIQKIKIWQLLKVVKLSYQEGCIQELWDMVSFTVSLFNGGWWCFKSFTEPKRRRKLFPFPSIHVCLAASAVTTDFGDDSIHKLKSEISSLRSETYKCSWSSTVATFFVFLPVLLPSVYFSNLSRIWSVSPYTELRRLSARTYRSFVQIFHEEGLTRCGNIWLQQFSVSFCETTFTQWPFHFIMSTWK